MIHDRLRLHLAGAAAAAALTMSTALAQDVTFTAGTIGVPAMISTQELENFAKEVGEESGGRIEIKVYTNSQLGSGQEQMEAVAFGTQDIFLSALSEASRLVPSFGALDAAFLFKDEDHVRRFMESDMWSTLETRLADEFGVGIITANWFDLPRHLLHREKFISEVEDVAGVRVRAPGIPMYIQNYINMGAEPITIAYGEQYLALSQGVVDMTESAADRIMGLKLHEVAPYITEADMMFPLSALYVNQAKWDALSEEDRAMMSLGRGEGHNRGRRGQVPAHAGRNPRGLCRNGDQKPRRYGVERPVPRGMVSGHPRFARRRVIGPAQGFVMG